MKNTTTYVLDFLKKLPRKQNIPVIIYLCINILLLFFFDTLLIEAIFSDITDGVAFAISVPFSLLIYAAGIFVALSPAGEWILRKKTGCKTIADDDENKEKLTQVFNEVYSRAKIVNPDLADDIQLYYVDEEDVNAFAVGRKSIAVTKGAMELGADQLKGIIGHEFGHLSNHDTDLTLVVNIANWFVAVYFLIARIYVKTIKVFAKGTALVMAIFSSSIGEFITYLFASKFVDLVYFLTVTLATAAWTALGNLLIKASSRGNEYLADDFSKRLGYGAHLASFLSTIDDRRRSLSAIKRLACTLSDTHPSPEKRVQALRTNYNMTNV